MDHTWLYFSDGCLYLASAAPEGMLAVAMAAFAVFGIIAGSQH